MECGGWNIIFTSFEGSLEIIGREDLLIVISRRIFVTATYKLEFAIPQYISDTWCKKASKGACGQYISVFSSYKFSRICNMVGCIPEVLMLPFKQILTYIYAGCLKEKIIFKEGEGGTEKISLAPKLVGNLIIKFKHPKI